MCTLYRLDSPPHEVAAAFRADQHDKLTVSTLISRGSMGLVIANGALRRMHWGLPNNLNRPGAPWFDLRALNTAESNDKDSWMGHDSFVRRRCLVPMTAFAEQDTANEGSSWFGLAGDKMFSCAGVWRDTLQAGPVFTLVMAQGENGSHGKPIVLAPLQFSRWLFGRTEEAESICNAPPLVTVENLVSRTACSHSPMGAV